MQINTLLKETFAPSHKSAEMLKLIEDESRKVRISSISPSLRLGSEKSDL
jgi:UDP-N-acetyl-D-mannosaminuronate dehydrogenase